MATPPPYKRRHQPRKGSLVLYAILLAAAVALMVGLRKCGGASSDPQASQPRPASDDTIRVAIVHSPMSYYIYDDTIGGLNYDMLRRMSADMGRPVRFIPVVSLPQSLKALSSGACDMLASLPVTSSMRDKYLFSESVFLDRQVLVQRRGSDGKAVVTSVLDLAGDTVHIEKDSPATERLQNLSDEIGEKVTIISHADLSDEYLFLKVLAGELRYAVINENTARRMAAKHPEVSADTPVGFTQFQSWLTRRTETGLHEAIDTWLVEFKKSDDYKALLKRYSVGNDSTVSSPVHSVPKTEKQSY